MKTLLITLPLLLILGPTKSEAQTRNSPGTSTEPIESEFDSVLAKKLAADPYGMKKYVLAFLKAGPKRDQDSLTAAKLQRAHLQNIQRLADEGKLILAGPFLSGSELRGLYVFNVSSIDEARALTETDPAVQAGRLTMELHSWYGSAAVQLINDLHKRIAKTHF